MKTLTRGRWMAYLAGVVLAAPSAMAQPAKADPNPPFDVPGLVEGTVWLPWVFAFLFVAACGAVAFKNPRRSHLD